MYLISNADVDHNFDPDNKINKPETADDEDDYSKDYKDLLTLLHEGESLAESGDNEKAIEYLQRGRKLSEYLGKPGISSECSFKLGKEFLIKGDIVEAIIKFYDNLIHKRKFNDRRGQCRAHQQLIQAFRDNNFHYAAYNHLEEYYQLCEELGDENGTEWASKQREELVLLIKNTKLFSKQSLINRSTYKSIIDETKFQNDGVKYGQTLMMFLSETTNITDRTTEISQRTISTEVFNKNDWGKQYEICDKLFNMKQFSKALQYSKKALLIAKVNLDGIMEGMSLMMQSAIFRELNDKEKAIEGYENLLALDHKHLNLMALLQLEKLYLQKAKELQDNDGPVNDIEQALFHCDKYKSLRNDLLTGYRSLFQGSKILADIFHASGNYIFAIKIYEKILSHMISDDINNKIAVLIMLGHSNFLNGNNNEAYDNYIRSIELSSDWSLRKLRAPVYFNLFQINLGIGKNPDAIENLQMYLFISEKLDDDIGILLAYKNLCNVCKSMGQYSEALKYAERFKSYSEKLDDRENYLEAHEIIQNLREQVQLQMTTEPSTSQINDQNRKARREKNVKIDECRSLLGLSRIEARLSDFSSVIETLNRAKEIAEKTNEPELTRWVYEELGGIYHKIARQMQDKSSNKSEVCRNYKLAMKYYKKILNNPNYQLISTDIYSILGNICLEMKNGFKALFYFEKSLMVSINLKIRKLERDAYVDLAKTELFLQNPKRSIVFYKQAFQLAEELNKPILVAKLSNDLANVYYYLVDFQKSLEYIELYLKLSRNLGDINGQAIAYFSLSYLNIRLGNYQSTIEYANFHYAFANEIRDRNGVFSAIINNECAKYLLNKKICS